MYAHCGLTLSEFGLHYYLPNANPIFNILITEDHVKIAEIMGFDYSELEAAKEYDQFFKLLLTNKFFRPSRFLVDTTDGEVKMFKELAEFLENNKPVYKGYTKRQIEDMFEPLKEFDFESKFNKLHNLYENSKNIKSKINGAIVLKYVPNFDKTLFPIYFDNFNNYHFKSTLDRIEFIYSHSEKEIVDEFLACNTNITTRQLAIKKWNLLSDEDKKQYYDNYVNSGKFTMALSFKELTGSEVEFILTK